MSSGSVLIVLDRLQGHVTARIRGDLFQAPLESLGWRVGVAERTAAHSWFSRSAYKASDDRIAAEAANYDLVYLLKVPSLGLIRRIRAKTDARLIFDLTDALWRPPFRAQGWTQLDAILGQVDAVFAENEYVGQYARHYNDSIFLIPACTQPELFEKERLRRTPRRADGIVIGWVGSRGTVTALRAVRRPLEELFARNSNLELRVVGCDDPSVLPPFDHVRYTLRGDYDEAGMVSEILGMDIGIYPPPLDTPDYELRGGLKAMLYMSASVPVVCQRAGDPAGFIHDGVNGMLADTDAEWLNRLEQLVSSPELRRRIGRSGFDTVAAEHSLKHVTTVLDRSLNEVLVRPSRSGRTS